MQDKIFCKDCKCWELTIENFNVGFCKLNPPTNVSIRTAATDYCFVGKPKTELLNG